MKAFALSQFPDIWLTLLGLFLFMGVFFGWVWAVYLRPQSKHLQEFASLALDDTTTPFSKETLT